MGYIEIPFLPAEERSTSPFQRSIS